MRGPSPQRRSVRISIVPLGVLVAWLLVLLIKNSLAATNERAEALPTAGEPITGKVLFETDILPILTSAGCNAGACHGKARGQNGFALSLLGFDADFDYAAIVKNARGRRVFPAAADNSLLLLKASGQLPHGGGIRLSLESPEYQLVRSWIATGLPRATPEDPILKGIDLSPAEHVLPASSTEQLVVTAHYSDGSARDVTRFTNFDSNESAIVAVAKTGFVRAGALPGEATIMARYMGNIATWNTAIPLPGDVLEETYSQLPRSNLIDGLVWDKLKNLGILPSGPAPETTFLRRVHLDLIGRLPTAAETRAYLADASSDKRSKLIRTLLDRPEYADYWANKWADLLRPNPYRVGIKATFNLDAWLRQAFRENMPYDQFVRQLVTAQGSTWRNGAVTIFRDRRSPDEITTLVSQLFLGTRLECAKCHQHPFEVWGQKDFYSLAAYFARVGYKGAGLSPPISGGEEIVFTAPSGSVTHPLTGEALEPQPLFGTARPTTPEEDPRTVLMDWMLGDGRMAFSRVAVNRVWAEVMGRGLVDPVDDLRATNPPSNPPLLDALATEFERLDYDLKKLLQLITSSYVYGLSSLPNERNVSDNRNYSRHYRQRLRAEPLWDAVADVTESSDTFAAMAPGSRAVELWTNRVDSRFLDAFGRPDANQDPPCERTADTTVVQALHLMNAPAMHQQITSSKGRAARLAATDLPAEKMIEEIYLTVYSRHPSPSELQAAAALYTGDQDRRQTTEDLLWALLNTPEFVFKD